MCSLSDLQKCGQCEVAGIAHPFIVEELFNGIAYTMKNRSSVPCESSGRNDYEHLPKPERVDDIIVYFGGVVLARLILGVMVQRSELLPLKEQLLIKDILRRIIL